MNRTLKKLIKTKKNLIEKIYLADTGIEKLDNFIDLVYDKYGSIIRFIDRVKLAYFWASKLNNTYDFDCHDIYMMIYLKLDRAYKYFKDHGHCVWNSSENTNLMKKLKECKELAKRLYDDELNYRAFKEADEKFKLYWSEKNEGSTNIYLQMTYKLNPKRAEFFKKGKNKIYSKENQNRKERFYYLLNKYQDYFWD